MKSLARNIYFFRKLYFLMLVVLFIHNGSLVFCSNPDMEVDENDLQKSQSQLVFDTVVRNKSEIENEGSPFEHTKRHHTEIDHYIKLSKEYKKNINVLSRKEKEKAIEINVYVAQNTLDLWFKFKYFQRAQDLRISKEKEINVLY